MLFLLAHTNVYATIISISFGLSLMIEAFVRNKELVKMDVSMTKLVFAFALAILGVVLFFLYMQPFQSLVAGILGGSQLLVLIKKLFISILLPGSYFKEALGFKSGLFASLVIWTIFVYLLRKPFIFLIFFLSVAGIGLFHEWFSAPLFLRHQGLFVILIIVVFWLDRLETRTRDYPFFMDNISKRLSFNMNLFVMVLMVMQVCGAFFIVKGEVYNQEYSSSKSFGNLISGRPEFRKAIIIGEPDYNMESLPYYVDNQIYIAREGRFGKYADWAAKKRELSLNELLNIAIILKIKYDKPILLTIGHSLSDHGPFKIKYSYNKIFTYDSDSLYRFRKQTSKVASFRQAKLETYDVFLLK